MKLNYSDLNSNWVDYSSSEHVLQLEKVLPEEQQSDQKEDKNTVFKTPIALPPNPKFDNLDMEVKPDKFVRLCPAENLPSLAERKKHMLTHLPHATSVSYTHLTLPTKA